MLSDMYHIILVNYPFFLTPPLEFQSTRSNFRIYIYIPVHLTSEMKKNRRESREEGSIVSQGPLTSFQLLSPRPWPKRHFNRRRRPPPLVSKPPIKSKGESLVEFSDAVPLPLPLHQPRLAGDCTLPLNSVRVSRDTESHPSMNTKICLYVDESRKRKGHRSHNNRNDSNYCIARRRAIRSTSIMISLQIDSSGKGWEDLAFETL